MNADGSRQELLDTRDKCAIQIYTYYQKRMAISSDDRFKLTVDSAAYGTDINVRDVGLQLVRRVNAFYATNYDPSWSPDGSLVAFVSQADGNDEIYVVEVSGTRPRRLTTNAWEWDKHPTWAPDGKLLAFWSNRNTGRKQIWVMAADGTNPHDISINTYNDWDPIWVGF